MESVIVLSGRWNRRSFPLSPPEKTMVFNLCTVTHANDDVSVRV